MARPVVKATMESASFGMLTAEARGVRFGRPPKLKSDRTALGERRQVGARIAKLFEGHHAPLYRALTALTVAA